jgi:hypothetical protein
MVLAPAVSQLPTYRFWGVTVVHDELFLLAALLIL